MRSRVHPLVSLAPSPEFVVASHLHVDRGLRAPPLGFGPPSRHQPGESTCRRASQSRLRSALDVSHVLDGFRLTEPSWACFIPQPRPRLLHRGLLPTLSAADSHRRLPSCPWALLACSEASSAAPAPRAWPPRPSSERRSVGNDGGVSSATYLVPLSSFQIPRVLRPAPSGRLRAPSAHDLTGDSSQ